MKYIRSNCMALSLIFFMYSGGTYAEPLSEKLKKAYDAGYNAGFSDALHRPPGSKGSETIGPIFSFNGGGGTKGYELPLEFQIKGMENDELWDTEKIVDALNRGENIEIQGYVFDKHKLLYGKTKVFLDSSAPGKALISGADGIETGSWAINPDAAKALSISELLGIEVQNIEHGAIFEGIVGQ